MKSVLKFTVTAITFGSLMFSCSDDESQAVQNVVPEPVVLEYSNGPLSTGTTSAMGAQSPADFTWSEIQLNNTSLGFSASQTSGYQLADDFTVPDGETWNITKTSFFVYQTSYEGSSYPIDFLSFEIYDQDPSLQDAVPIYGDMNVDKLSSGESAKTYRITKETAVDPINTYREIFKVSCDITDLSLGSGTYWIVWWSKATDGTTHFYPPVTIKDRVSATDSNAIQFKMDTNIWKNIVDATSLVNQDFPFELSGTIIND